MSGEVALGIALLGVYAVVWLIWEFFNPYSGFTQWRARRADEQRRYRARVDDQEQP